MKGNPEAMAAVRAGATVYHNRSKPLVFALFGVILLTFAFAPSPLYAAACLAVMYVFVDFYGAVLHVVLDHPAFIDLPLIGAGCLEFQCVLARETEGATTTYRIPDPRLIPPPPLPPGRWHHAIPQDIVSKSFIEVCGDLNLVVLLHFMWIYGLFGWKDSAANVMVGAKLAAAYLGQWAHRMAHTAESKRPQWVRSAQSCGLLVSPDLHKEHHTTYNDGFPILSGVTAPLIGLLNAWIPNKYVWLAIFAVSSFADVWALKHLVSAAFTSLGLVC